MILDTIVAQKQLEVEVLLSQGITYPDCPIDPPRGFKDALIDYPGVSLIAEAKKASPSKGVIRPEFDPVSIGLAYEAGGAQAMSVLTDEKFFQGSLDYIPLIRQEISLPVLRKDFIIHEVQVSQASRYGADAILLIAAILDVHQMQDLQAQCTELNMDALVEVHDEKELEKALKAESSLIGINNRNLNDFSMDLETTFRLKREIPVEIPVVSESGIRDVDDIKKCEASGIAAVLVGETLMRASSLEKAISELMGR
jgi:indole-3-glycerol phosphate synthase